ncbi:hypothetical protein HYQ46_004826 [Verticillium longisporum]|nr:hypothetical protein HYQ46_004826 [Verticillium longisporum]
MGRSQNQGRLEADILDSGHVRVGTVRLPRGISAIKVPVLSKQATSMRPAKGMRKGSVQKMASLARAARLVLTARLSSIGSSGGTTLVTIKTQSSRSLERLRSLRTPSSQTYQEAAMAKIRRKRIKKRASTLLAETRSVE